MEIRQQLSNALRAIPATALAAKKSNLKSCQNRPKWFLNLSTRGTPVSPSSSCGAWRV